MCSAHNAKRCITIARRQLACETGLIQNADGSAQFKHGNTTVLATVHGPKAASHRDQQHDTAVLDVVWRSRHDTGEEGDASDKIKEHSIRQALESAVLLDAHPRASITLTCTVLYDDGAAVACAVNAACAALVNAGIAMRGMCGAMAAAVDAHGEVLVDCTRSEEEHAAGGALVVGLIASGGEPLMVEVEGVMGDAGEADNVVQCCVGALSAVGGALRGALSTVS